MFQKHIIPLLHFSLYLCLGAGLLASWQVFFTGLGVTNLNNQYVFGLWIIFDLVLIALASGAMCTAFLYYILKFKALRSLMPLAFSLGLLCYLAAGFILLLEIGQPLRAWFPFRHPNFISMLTEITFCLTFYLVVLLLEFLLACRHKLFKDSLTHGWVNWLRARLGLFLPALVLLGVCLSLLHQGSLGGVYGVLEARPFAWRPGLFIWPWTFVLFVTSALSAGPLFTLLVAAMVEKFSGHTFITTKARALIAKICALFLGLNLVLRLADFVIWKYWLLPQTDYTYSQMFHGLAFGQWLFWAELCAGNLLPLLLLLNKKTASRPALFNVAGFLACCGLVLSRYIINLQTLAVPTLPFDTWANYWPNWQEIAPCLLALAFIALGLRLLYRQGLLLRN